MERSEIPDPSSIHYNLLTTIEPAAFLLGEEGGYLPGAVNPAQTVKSCHLRMHQSSSQTTREEGRERKGWKLTAS